MSDAPADRVTWAERVADRSPVVQRSKDRSFEQARVIVDAARRLVETKGPTFTTQELIKEAVTTLRTRIRRSRTGIVMGQHSLNFD